jgi:chromosome segregation ATPase
MPENTRSTRLSRTVPEETRSPTRSTRLARTVPTEDTRSTRLSRTVPTEDTRSSHSSKSVRPKKTKQEKIFELEARLKVAAEENNGLQKDIKKLRDGQHGSSRPSNVDVGDAHKMKDALKALKRVTVNQEMGLKTLRDKAQLRRQELKEKDAKIYSLQRQVRSLKKAMNGSGNGLEEKLDEMQKACFQEENRSVELEERLGKSELEVRRLQKQQDARGPKGGLKRILSNGSLKSAESTSTAAEFDVARLKKELANKTNKIVQLEMQMEALNDDMHDFQQQDAAGKNPFGSDPFASKVEDSTVEDSETDDDGFGPSFGDFNKSCTSFAMGETPYSDDEEEEDNFW